MKVDARTPPPNHPEAAEPGLTLLTMGSGPRAKQSPINLLPLPDLLWKLRDVMSRILPEDLSAAELSALLGVLIPAQARVVGRPAARPGLHVVGS